MQHIHMQQGWLFHMPQNLRPMLPEPVAGCAAQVHSAQMRRRHAAYLCDVLAQSTADWICLSRQALMQRYAHYVDEVRAALVARTER